ncbi:MAG TPA: ATP-binding protein [Burkholderiales bacterium]
MRLSEIVTRIGLKLVIAVSAVTIVIIGAFSYFSIRAQSAALLSQAGIHANRLSDAIKNATLTGMLENRKEEVHAIIETVAHEPSIMDIRILNKEGVVTYSSRKDLIGKMVNKRAESCYACHTENQPLQKLSMNERMRVYRISADSPRILGVINPIYNMRSCYEAACHAHTRDQTVLGVLDVRMDLRDVDQQIEDSKLRLIVFAAVAIVALSLFIAYLVRLWVGKPVSELVKATHQVSAGNFQHRVDDLGKDELGILGQSFNRMTKHLAEARLQLFQSDKMAALGRLAAGVAHEINNPLTAVLTYSSFLEKRTKDNPELQADLGVIVRETIRSREIVKNLLDFARQSVPNKTSVDINKIIANALQVVAAQLTHRNIEVAAHFDPSLPQITLDGNQIQQVFINLLVNGADAIGEGGGRISIDLALIRLSLYGLAPIRSAVCPRRHDLMDDDTKIGGLPTIRLKVAAHGKQGFLNLDPIYGKQRHQYGIDMQNARNLAVCCPQCDTSLIEADAACPECGSRVYAFEVPPHGRFEGCTSPACQWQRWQAIDELGQQDYIEVRIADTGKGIAKEEQSRLFEPFYTTKGQHGTGLGLAVSWRIIDNHNGTIHVASEPGQGTTFVIHLPLSR